MISTPTFFRPLVTVIIADTNLSFLVLTIFSFIFLYRLSTRSGTASIAVGFDSCKFGTTYFSPSHIAIEEPQAIGSKYPIVDS